MDCEKFDQHMIDALYGELDELTHAAMKRHMESCSRCASSFEGLRATRDVGVLPLEEPSEDLEARILEAVSAAQKTIPWHRKALRALAWAGSHAMRPQLAMAALFVLVIGSSLLLLRAKPGTIGVAPVRVTERGTPVPEEQTASPVTTITPTPEVEAEHREKDNGPKAAARASSAAPDDGARAALAEARTVREQSGCAGAVGLYDSVGARFPGTAQAADAMWEAAACHKSLGNTAKARDLYLSLQSTETYRTRAEQEIALSESNVQNQAPAATPAASATSQAVAQAADPYEPATEAKAQTKSSAPASTGKAVAAPARAKPKAGSAPVPAAPARDAAY